MVRKSRKGTMLMEAVLTVPLVIVIFLVCFQFIMIAYAKLMTEHAAHVALRVAEVQSCTADRTSEALSAARRILAPVSWSMTVIDLEQYKSKIPKKLPGQLDGLKELVESLPDSLNLEYVDVPKDARQPLGWFPLWNTGWLEDQVAVTVEQQDTPVPRLICEVKFKCPLHVPVAAQLLSTPTWMDSNEVEHGYRHRVTETFSPKIVFGKMKGPEDMPCLVLKTKAFRLLTNKSVKDIMPVVEKGGITGL